MFRKRLSIWQSPSLTFPCRQKSRMKRGHTLNKILKKIDSLVGLAAIKILEYFMPDGEKQLNQLTSLLFIRPGGIGDAVLLIQSITQLKKAFPQIKIDVLAEKRNGNIFSLCSDINRVFLYDRLGELISVIRKGYDAAIDTEQWHRLSAVVAKMTGAPMLIGYATNERARLFTHPITYFHDNYEAESFSHLIAPLVRDVPFDVAPPFLTVPDAARQRAGDILHSLLGRKVVAIFPGGTIRERRWGSDRFHAVAKILAERGYGVAVVGGREDVESGREIASGLENTVDVCGRLSLVETAGVLERVALLITGDSGIMHIAYGLGTPTVSLFGPGIEKKWAPRGENHIVINKHLPCSPCTRFGYTPRCAYNVACMRQITVNEVYARALELLER